MESLGRAFIALAVVTLAVSLRSRLVLDEVIAQTTGPQCLECTSLAGMTRIAIISRHYRWANLGWFPGEDVKRRNRSFDHGVTYDCLLKSDPAISGTDYWRDATQRSENVFQFLGLAVRSRISPVRCITVFIPDWIIIAILAGSGILAIFRAKRRRRDRMAAGALPCSSCGYDLRGAPTVAGIFGRRCSECGAIAPSAQRPRKPQRQR